MKKTFAAVLALCLLLCAAACGEKAAADFSLEDCSRALLASDAFTDLLSPITAETAAGLYSIDASKLSEAQVYCSTGATAEEIALFKAADEAAAKEIKAACETRIASQKESYESYVPEEVPKLEKAIVRMSGVYVVYVTAADPAAAESILDGYIK